LGQQKIVDEEKIIQEKDRGKNTTKNIKKEKTIVKTSNIDKHTSDH